MSNGENKLELDYDSRVLWVMTRYFSVSRGVKKSELGCDICTSWAAALPCLFCVPLFSFRHLCFIDEKIEAGWRGGTSFGDLRKRAGEARCASALLNPCLANWAALGAQWNLKKWLPCSSIQEELWAARASQRAVLLRAVQTTLPNSRLYVPWSQCFMSCFFLFHPLPWPAASTLGLPKAAKWGSCFTWRFLCSCLKCILKDCAIKTVCFFLINIVSFWSVSQ